MSKTMLAGTFGGVGILDIKEIPVPKVKGDDWVLIKNEGCGVCGSDLHILADPPGFEATLGAVLGHEFLGHIVEVGTAVQDFKVGDRVAVNPNMTCGICRYCKAGLPNHCENWTTLGLHQDGGFAAYTTAPQGYLHRVAEDLPFERAVWTEPLSCVVNGTDKIGIQPVETAVVIGAGPIGLLHGMMFKAAGARVIISDLAPVRLEAAKTVGMDVVVNGKEQDLREVVMDVTNGMGAEVVADTVGNQFGNAVKLAARGGKIALFGMIEHATPAVKQHDITRNELSVIGVFVSPYTFPRAIQILESGIIDPSPLNTLTLPVADMQQGIDAARAGEAVKVVIKAE
ncbi:MAG: alcohol dehydrogenase catalytic domain-containing protein [Ardenticatenaceae bacterium]|nr:alcohol dehydrogenase catalytic domain-containing protein [Ardenticatenaceae bacterium]